MTKDWSEKRSSMVVNPSLMFQRNSSKLRTPVEYIGSLSAILRASSKELARITTSP